MPSATLVQSFTRIFALVKSTKLVLAVFFAGNLIFASQLAAESKSTHAHRATSKSSDGVVVRKNPDGTIETFEAASAPQPLDDPGEVQSTRAAAPRAYSKTIGGVHVRRNADGTIETYEPPSKPVPLYPVASRSKSTGHAARHSK